MTTNEIKKIKTKIDHFNTDQKASSHTTNVRVLTFVGSLYGLTERRFTAYKHTTESQHKKLADSL